MRAPVLVPCLVAATAVGLGLLLGLASTRSSPGVGALRTLAFTAALTVALTHLLPEALAELGAPGMLLFAATSVGPAWGRMLRGKRGSHGGHAHGGHAHGGHAHGHAALSAGYLGLLVHHVGDGLGLGAYSELPGGPLAHADVLLALAVHTVPLVAVVTLAFRSVSGTRAAVERAAGLGAASLGGVLLSAVVPSSLVHSLSAWIAAGVAGLLMHVVTHDLGRDLPATSAARALDAGAAAFGVGVSMLGADPDLVTLHGELRHVLVQLLELGAPALVLGWAVALMLGRLRHEGFARWLAGLPGPARGLDGALVGTAIAGPRFGILFWVGTALTARLVALRTPADSPAHPSAHAPDSHPTLAACVRESAPWIVTGLALATLLVSTLRDQTLAGFSAPVALAGAAAFALPLELPAVASVLIACGLWDRGLRSDAALAFALVAAARKGSARSLGFALLVGLGVASVNQRSSLYVQLPEVVSLAGIVVLALGVAFAAWERGVRGMFTRVFHSHDSA
jgi:hypothetical protein